MKATNQSMTVRIQYLGGSYTITWISNLMPTTTSTTSTSTSTTTTTTNRKCDTPTDPFGEYAVIDGDEYFTKWILSCTSPGYAPDPVVGPFAFCGGFGELDPPLPSSGVCKMSNDCTISQVHALTLEDPDAATPRTNC